MEYLRTNDTVGVKNNNIQIEINNEYSFIIFKINESTLLINREFINNKISPNFSVEMFYYVLCNFIKYNNYKLNKDDTKYIFEGYYYEPYDQGDEIYIKLIILN
jgi:hypothetical protein